MLRRRTKTLDMSETRVIISIITIIIIITTAHRAQGGFGGLREDLQTFYGR